MVLVALGALFGAFAAPLSDSALAPEPPSLSAPPPSAPDSLPIPSKVSVPRPSWFQLAIRNKLNLKDKTIKYPKFVGFCIDVYNWGDTTFNSYDSRYVVTTGRRWKAFLRNENWFDTYHVGFRHQDQTTRIDMMSDASVNLGAYLQYMAVSVGYSIDLSNIIGNKPINLKKFEFAFICARFTAELAYTQNTGGTYLRRFGSYNDGHEIKEFFPGARQRTLTFDAYYFFNNRKYSHGAAYSYAKYQIRSAGSLMLGFSYARRDISMNFDQLPADILQSQEIPYRQLDFKTDDYTLLCGYGYNWVFARNFLFNITCIPGIGISHCRVGAYEAGKDRLSGSLKGKFGITYTLRDFFCGVHGQINSHLFRNNDVTFFNSITNVSLSTGVRF